MSESAGFVDRIQRTAKKAFASVVKRRGEEKDRRKKKYQMDADEAYVMAKLTDVKRVRASTLESLEPIWTRSILYTAGVQHLRYIAATRTFEPVQYEKWLPTPVINEIQPKVQRIVDMFTRNRPQGHVVPNSKSETDREAASYGDNVVSHLQDVNHLEERYDEAAHWMVITGNTFAKQYVDVTRQTAVQLKNYQMVEEPMLGPDGAPIISDLTGQPVMTKRAVEGRGEHQGEENNIAVDILGSMHMVVPLAAPRLEIGYCPWVCEVSVQPTHVLKQLYPKMADYIEDSGHLITADLYQHRILSLLTSGVHGVMRSMDPYSLDGFTILYQYEMAPDRDFPNGMMLIATGDTPLHIDELPIKDAFSYEHAGYYRVPGRFWCRGVVEDLIDPQDQVNKLEQFLRLNDDHNSQPAWLVPEKSGIPKGSVSNKPGRVYRYHYPFKPEVIDGVSMPAQIVQRRAMYQEDIEELSGVRNVLMGNAPGGVTAGVALNRLGEEAEGIFAPIVKRWDRFIERQTTSMLSLVEKYWTIPRMLSVLDDDANMIQIEDFVGTMLRGNIKFSVQTGSYRPRSHAARQALALEAFAQGLLPQVMTNPEQHAKLLDLLGLDGFEADQSLDFKRAKWENEMLQRPDSHEMVRRQAADEDFVHLSVHSAERKRPSWYRLPNIVQVRHLMHETEHLKAIIESQGTPDPSRMTETDPEALEGSEEADAGNSQGGSSEQTGRPNAVGEPKKGGKREKVA